METQGVVGSISFGNSIGIKDFDNVYKRFVVLGVNIKEDKKYEKTLVKPKMKGETKMERIYYYYYRDAKNRPIVTVCLIKGENGIGRGMAICSPDDNPLKADGRKYARNRAYRAYWYKEVDDYIREDAAFDVLMESNYQLSNSDFANMGIPKIHYNPELTDFEEKLLSKASGREI